MARFPREYFMNEPRDLAVFINQHLTGETRQIGGLKIIGAHDAPRSVELYVSMKPEYNEHPFAVYTRNDMDELHDPLMTPAPKPAIIRRTKR